jgi:hypothetical protein
VDGLDARGAARLRTYDFKSFEAAQAFVKSEELKTAMQKGNVVGAPTIWFANRK